MVGVLSHISAFVTNLHTPHGGWDALSYAVMITLSQSWLVKDTEKGS